MSTLHHSPAEPDTLMVGFTGTLPAYRGRGLATELKRRAVEFARTRGYQVLRTFNDSENPRISGDQPEDRISGPTSLVDGREKVRSRARDRSALDLNIGCQRNVPRPLGPNEPGGRVALTLLTEAVTRVATGACYFAEMVRESAPTLD